RLAAVHGALPAVFESGSWACREGTRCGLQADARCWLMGAGASLAAARFWELTVPDGDDGDGDEQQKLESRKLFVRVLGLYRPFYRLLAGGFLFLASAVACETFIPHYTGRVIDILSQDYQQSQFTSAVLWMGLFSLGSSVSAGCRGGFLLCAISAFTRRIKHQLFAALTKQEAGFFESVKTGQLTSRLSEDTVLMARTVCLNANVMLRTFIQTVGTIYFMMSLSWKLTCLVLMETPLTAALQRVYSAYDLRLSLVLQNSMAEASEAVTEAVSGIRVVQSFNAGKHEARRYGNLLMKINTLKIRQGAATAVYGLARRIGLAMQVLMLYYGRQFIQDGQMTTGSLVSFILYQSQLGLGIMDFCLELRPGQMTALVGASGEGKSTCVSLLQRLYEPQQGQIRLDGRPLSSYEHRFLHDQIAVVNQDPVLFSTSIRDNIAYGRPDCSLEQVQEAARQANAHDFISNLENGYQTELGEADSLLSKSERQRIAIARALVRRPLVLVLDEVTSSLDAHAENQVQQALAACSSRTLLVIAHRLRTIEGADQIVVVSRGGVAEQGTHQQLMGRRGLYYRQRERLFTAPA
uniref:Transporter associated with antigen processing, subunit type a n=1 Tax=Tetraodon nigroviridis TaxID=99883 RepID=H3BW29_TETNG